MQSRRNGGLWFLSFCHILESQALCTKQIPHIGDFLAQDSPTTIGQKLTSYQHLALCKTKQIKDILSGPCSIYAVCGLPCKIQHILVPNVLQTCKNETFLLKQNLTCVQTMALCSDLCNMPAAV